MPIHEDTGEPDYARATPERTREFLYNELGLETDEADAYVGNNAEQAREELEKAKNSKPKMEKGKTLTQFLSEKAAWQQQMDEAQRNVDYWEGVKNAGQETAGEQRMSLRKNSLTIGEQAETAVNSAVERRKAESIQQDFSVTEISGEGNAENANGNEERNSYVNRRKVDDGTDGDLEQEITPAIGPFGEIYTQFKGKPQEAITYLLAKKGGEAVGALYHKDIGSIDIVWGEEGTGHSDGFGLAKLAKFHPEVLFNLQDILNDMVVTRRSENRVQLESEKYKASVRLTWDNKKKTWLLTMFEKKNSVLDNTTDTGKTLMGNGNDTATPENTVSSASKGRESVISDQGKSKKNAENQQESAGNVENDAPEASLRNGMEPGNAKQENAGEASAKMRSMMERIAEKLGYRIEWHETIEQNGLFDPKTKTIHIALDAENPLAAVFGHESMHRIAENAEDYKSILALAKEVLGEEEFERRVDDAEKRYRDAGYDKPSSYYEEEAVCDFMGEMLDNDRLLERVCWDANHRVLAAIRNVIDRILAAIGMADARLMHVRLTVSAAYNNAIRRTETEGEVPTKEGELRASLLRKHDVDRMSAEYHSGKKTGITKKVFDAAQKAMDAMYDMMLPYYEATALGKRMLPEERYGRKGAASTIFSNGSYGKTMENTLKCIRTLAYNEFTDDVKRAIGRPLTQKESFLASQMVYDISSDPQCLYCYVSLDRKAYDEFLLRYMQQRDGVLGKFREMDASKRAIGKTAPHTALPELYAEFLDKRKDTKQQQERFDMWIRNEIDGAETITAADLSTADVRSAVLEGLDASMARQVKDAEKYAQSASWAKKDVDYISYVGELLKLSPAWIKKLTGEYGLRFYSFSEYTPAFLLENMQMVRDAALRGLRGLGYTKELDFVKVFAPTGMNINCSCYGRMDSDGNMQMDTRQGADWEEVKRLRGQYRNVGAVFVATNDAAVEWALAQDWIDVVIPFHIVRTGQDIADFYGWSNYSKEQADSVVGSSKKMYISPVEHKNDKAAFLAACEKHGVTPRFAKWLDNPNYMKLVNETRLSVDESSDLQPVFDMDAAADSWKRFVNTGGYYNGWWNVDAEGYADAVRTVVEDIRSGKMANEVDYGRQDVPANVEKMVAAARKKRIHGNVPLVDVYDRSGNALSSGGKRASLRKQKTGSSASEVTEAERALRDELNNVLTRAGIDVVTDVEEGQRVLDDANGKGVRMQAKKRALETVSVTSEEEHQPTVVSSADGAKVLKKLDETREKYDNISNRINTFIGDVAEALGAQRKGSKSEYATFETKNGRIVTIRLADHNATVSNFDRRGELDGISIVVSPKKSEGITNDGDAHVVEYYYDAIKLRRAEGKPLADIVRSIKQALYSGEFKDTTGLAVPQEVNEGNIRFFRTSNGDAYGFTLNGKVYIDPRMVNAETPIHEYTHLWATALRERNKKEWKNVVELMKGTAVWDEVVRTYPELKTDDEIADEVLSQYSGRRGAERLRREMDDVLKSDSGITEKAAAVRAINNVRSALNSFWRSVARMLGLRYTSAEDVADCVLRDMLNLEKPGEKPAKEDLKYMMGDSSETFQERQKRAVANKGTVMPGLNEAQVKVVDVPRHEYEGNWFEAVGKAVHDAIKKFTRIEKDEKGKEKRVSIPQHYNNFGAKFDYIISKKSIEESINEKQVKKSLEGEAPRGVHLAVLNNLDKVISESIEVEEHPDYIKKDGKRSPENGFKSDILVHRFIGAIRVDEKEYRVKTTMYEYKQTDRKSREYAYDVTKIEVLDDTTTSTSDDLVGATMGLKPLAKLLKDVEKSYDKGKKILEESKLADKNAPVYREGESVDNSETDSESQEDYDLYRTVEEEDTIAFLEGQPSVTTYRSMVLIDGKLYPPMSSKESGSKQLRNPSELGKWEEAEEAPDKAYKKGDGWYFDLKKDNGKTVGGVAYNPYIHTSTTMLNDQFSEAQDRDNLVVVEMHVPESELTSGYQAEKAKDSVGVKEWKAGIIQGMLSGTREVILTRWAKPVRIVPVEEVAENIAKMIEGKVEVMPSNVVTPQQRKALEERGVEFVETDNKGKMSAGVHKGKTWSSVFGKKSKKAKKSVAPSRIKSAVDTLCKKLNLDNVEILDDASGLEGKRKKAKGFYNRKTGKITIVLSNATSVSDAVQTLLHEAVAHYGLRKMFGAHFDTFLDNVFRSADENVRKKIAELSRKHGFDIRTATEEYLASLAEDTNFEKENAGWWQKVKAMFADMLRNMGLNETMCSRCGMPFFGKQKHRTSLMETSALLMQNIRTFYQRSPMFCNFRTIASLPLQKKFFKKNLHFLHPPVKPLVFTGHSG